MSRITLAIRHASQAELLLRWQVHVNAAFAGGSLIAALLNLGALVALSIARSGLPQRATDRRKAECHA